MSLSITKFGKLLADSWKEGTQIDRSNIFTAAFVGAPAHISLYFLYTYLLPLPYENFYLRLFISFLCASVVCYEYLPHKIKIKYFPFYWHLMVNCALIFNSVFFLLKNNFNEVYLYWIIFTTFLMAFYIPNWLIFLIDFFISVVAAIFFFLITTPQVNLDIQFNVWGYCSVLFFTILFSGIFIHANKRVWLRKQEKSLTSLAGAIVHEVRNPLNAINLNTKISLDILKSVDLTNEQKIEKILENKNDVLISINQANEIIDIALNDLKQKPISSSEFSYLKADEILPKIVKEYGYKTDEEKLKIRLEISQNNFVFKAIEQRFIFVVYNLIKNALYYSNNYPDSFVKIDLETRKIFNKATNRYQEYNVIFIYDNGPGIKKEILPKLFEDFITFGKKEGTGLGLAFCKRNMLIFGGDIICESLFGKDDKNGWTKFSLLFPKLSEKELALNWDKINSNQALKVLLISNKEDSINSVKNDLNNSFENIVFDLAENEKEALRFLKVDHVYNIILHDESAINFAKKLRKINKSIPIICYCEKPKDFESVIDDFAPKKDLARIISKWSLINSNAQKVTIQKIAEDNEEIIEKIRKLSKQKIILVDDELTNLMLLKKVLQNYAFEVVATSNMKDALEIYYKNFDEYKVIISDINLGHDITGVDLVKKIREYEKKNNISKAIPVIAYSGDGDKERIHQFLRCGISDYFVKGNNIKMLIEKLLFYFDLK